MAQGTINSIMVTIAFHDLQLKRAMERALKDALLDRGGDNFRPIMSTEDRLRNMGLNRANKPNHEQCAKMRRRHRGGKFGSEKPETFNDIAIGTGGMR